MLINLTDITHVFGLVATIFIIFQLGHYIGKGRDAALKVRVATGERKQAETKQQRDDAREELVKHLSRYDGRLAEAEARHVKAVAELEKSHALEVAELEEKIQELEKALAWHRAQGGPGPGMVDFR